MTFDELIEICEPLDVYGERPDQIGDLTQDSRQVEKGSVFIAVRGTQVDGHMFIDSAISKGASIIICEDPYYNREKDVCVLEVEDTRSLVGPLAQAFEGNPGKELVLTGITGTNGKTTVATLIYQVLKQLDARPSLLGTVAKRIRDKTLESLLTTADPIELARDMRRMVDANSTHLVMEVSSHALDQHRVDGLHFKVAAFTNLSHDHLDYHTSIEAYADSKKRLFDLLEEDAWAIVNADDEYAGHMIKDCPARVIQFSFNNRLSVDCRIISNTAEGLTIAVDDVQWTSPLAGTFNAYNLVTAFLVCRALGFDDEEIAQALQSAKGAPGRMEKVNVKGSANQPVVLVDYAHTPDALRHVLITLQDLKTGNEILHVIFGCGGNRDASKRPVMAEVAESYSDRVTVTSDNPRTEEPDAIIDDIMEGFADPASVTRITDRKAAIEDAIVHAGPDTIILVAGKGHETYQEIDGVRHPFDDRKVAREALGKRNGNAKPEEVA